MNVGFHNKKGSPAEIEDNIFTFSCAKPVIIQSAEIEKVSTGITLEIDAGYVLNIVSAPNIYEKSAEVFPGPYVIYSGAPKGVLEIPVRNHARVPLHLMEGSVVAHGYLTQVADVHIKEIEQPNTKRTQKKTTPAKRGGSIKFEVT